MVTIAHLVEKLVSRQPYLEEALSRGIVNYASLAEIIQPEIERDLKKKIKQSAAMMALRRYAEKIEKKEYDKVKFKDCDINLRSNLVEITIFKSPEAGNLIEKLYESTNFNKGEFFSVIIGVNEISVITNNKNKETFLKKISEKSVKAVIENLCSLTIHLPETAPETSGFFYLITRNLAWENIAIIEIISTLSETSYLVKSSDASAAFDVVKKVLEENVEKKGK
jgi:hypothetical protein